MKLSSISRFTRFHIDKFRKSHNFSGALIECIGQIVCWNAKSSIEFKWVHNFIIYKNNYSLHFLMQLCNHSFLMSVVKVHDVWDGLDFRFRGCGGIVYTSVKWICRISDFKFLLDFGEVNSWQEIWFHFRLSVLLA